MGALALGALSFAVGFAGPLFLSTSNLGPLLGIFITGPIGTIAGALWGIVASVGQANPADGKALALWLGGLWIVTLAYTLFTLTLEVPPRHHRNAARRRDERRP